MNVMLALAIRSKSRMPIPCGNIYAPRLLADTDLRDNRDSMHVAASEHLIHKVCPINQGTLKTPASYPRSS